MRLFNKKELTRISELENEISKMKLLIDSQNKQLEILGAKTVVELQNDEEQLRINIDEKKKIIANMSEYIEEAKTIEKLKNKEIDIQQSIADNSKKLTDLKKEVQKQKSQLFDIEDELTYQEFGLYKPRYDCVNSSEYSDKIKQCRKKQKKMIKDKTALTFSDQWKLDGSLQKGRAMNNDNMKMVLRAFNNECDAIINKVKFNNRDKIYDQINKAATAIDKLNVRNKITITNKYKELKYEELDLVYEYRRKKQDEKDTLREQRAEEREQAKLKKEIDEKRKKSQKELKHYEIAKEKYFLELSSCDADRRDEILEKIREIDEHINQTKDELQNMDYREANQRAGYVYIISNVGSFGENIYKIGMTRRLEPQDRVDELGDASVPFKFDVHAMIFSDDAPTLENNLHKEFEKKRVNMINGRKEFFHVTLEEIKEAVKKYNENIIEINDIPDAEQYRESLLIKKQIEELNKN